MILAKVIWTDGERSILAIGDRTIEWPEGFKIHQELVLSAMPAYMEDFVHEEEG